MRRRHPVLLGSALALAAAAPAAAADVQVKGLDTLVWDKPTVSIQAGDTVHWSFDGTTQFHNVQSGSDNWSFQSPLGAPAAPASFQFTTAGTYHFVCQVHPSTMVGDVIVGNAPPPPPPPPGQQPFVNDSAPPTVFETGGLDRQRPSVRRVRVRQSRKRTRLQFRVTEQARVTMRFKRGRKTVMTRRGSAYGKYRITVRSSRKLRPGRYRVKIRARDLAGNRSSVRTARFTLR